MLSRKYRAIRDCRKEQAWAVLTAQAGGTARAAGSAPWCPAVSGGCSVHALRRWQTREVHLAESARPAYFFIAIRTLLGFNATGNHYKHECNKNNHTQ